MPDWVADRRGRCHLSFADHKGDSIRLAVDGGVLSLADSLFPTTTPHDVEIRGEVQRAAVTASPGSRASRWPNSL